jgi:transcriptional regulator with XRE-family HTH domain
MRKVRPIPKTARRPTYIKQWRKHRNLTQVQLIDRLDTLGVDISEGQLSRIENGRQEYRQDQLEAVAAALNCTPADLIIRDPTDPDGIWSVWEGLPQVERVRLVEMGKLLRSTGAGG